MNILHDQSVTDRDDYDLFDLIDTSVNSTRYYMLMLYALARANRLISLVELGCLIGNTTAILAHAAKKNGGHVWTVDNDYDEGSIDRASTHISNLGLSDYVTFVRSDSWEAQEPCSCDLVFMDAQHDSYALDKDWITWSSRVDYGGFVAIHDVCGSPLRDWVDFTFPIYGWEHLVSPGDCGLLLARRLLC